MDLSTPVPVLFADERLIAVHKPAGVTVVPAPDAPPEASLRALVERQVGSRLWVVHRLDRDVSGVVVFARSAEVHRECCLAFEARHVRKTYLAFTVGAPSPREGRIDTPLHAARRGKTRPAAPGETGARAAATSYAVRTRWSRDGATVALVEIHPETGRHHQIRVHLRSVGTPILFDGTYGRGVAMATLDDAPCQRLALHASRLALPGPVGIRPLVIEAPLPDDMAALVHWLDGVWTPLAW
ncbi:MAG: RluA family pseudouridine synthase [Acidobacteria bacterium]|nr:RluA family pseudouridine synthase [Acidobacteriota bacterium]